MTEKLFRYQRREGNTIPKDSKDCKKNRKDILFRGCPGKRLVGWEQVRQARPKAENGIPQAGFTTGCHHAGFHNEILLTLRCMLRSLNTGLETKIISKDTYGPEITVPGKGIILKSLTVGNDAGYSVRSISLYCNDNYIVPHLINWDRNVDLNGNTTSYIINIALHNLYDGSRTTSKYGAITLHVK